ncbi:hypothetical protein Hanom_Chr15g01358141 [Helianthus anomalus]
MNFWCCHSWYLVLLRGVKMSFYTVIQRCNQTTLYWFSTYWFRVQTLLPIQTSYSFSTYWFRCCQTAP